MLIIEVVIAGVVGIWAVYNALDGLADARQTGRYRNGKRA